MNLVQEVMDYISQCDPEVGKGLEAELARQRRNLELIASENIVSPAVMLAMGTVPTNKYAEGYPGKRYYGGCEHVDEIETLAIERAKKLFGAGTCLCAAAFGSTGQHGSVPGVIQPGDTVMGDEPQSRRASDSWITGQSVREAVSFCTIQCWRGWVP